MALEELADGHKQPCSRPFTLTLSGCSMTCDFVSPKDLDGLFAECWGCALERNGKKRPLNSGLGSHGNLPQIIIFQNFVGKH